MSEVLVLDLTTEDGSVAQERVVFKDSQLWLHNWQLVAVSDNISQLTRVTTLRLYNNAFTEIPSSVLAMTQLRVLDFRDNRLATIPREINRLKALAEITLARNKVAALPKEICQLHALTMLVLNNNELTSLPSELGLMPSLRWLSVSRNSLAWLPHSLDRLPFTTEIFLNGNPLPIDVGPANSAVNSRSDLPKLFAATTALAMIREPSFDMLVGLQDLSLPALVTLEIVDAAFPNSIPMHLKWNLITAVKHFHDRH